MKINRQEVLEKYDNKCGYCGKDITLKSMQVDHIEPKCNVNQSNFNTINEIDNLMPTCRRCNHYKRGDNLKQFRHKMQTLHERVCSHYIGKVALDFGIVEIKPFDGKFYFETYGGNK
jgi:hypothetical protein